MDGGGKTETPEESYVPIQNENKNTNAGDVDYEALRTISDIADETICYEDNLEEPLVAQKKLIQASAICATFMIIEIIAGWIANSLALITDASHLISDLSSFLISLFAIWVSSLRGTHRLSFGYHRAEILGALMSVVCIWLFTGFLIVEACYRFVNPKPVKGGIMFATAFVGTMANVAMTYILGFHKNCHSHSDSDARSTHVHDTNQNNTSLTTSNEKRAKQQHTFCSSTDLKTKRSMLAADLQEAFLFSTDHADDDDHTQTLCSTDQNVNLRAAYIHALGDLVQNIGVLIAAGLIWLKPSWSIADPICTFVFSIIVLMTTFSIVRDATNVLMEGTPKEIDLAGLREDLAEIENVIDVHDLHVWSLSVGKPSLACHMVIDSEEAARRVLRVATRICQKRYGILHTTIQTDFSSNKLSCDTDAHAKCH